MAFFTYKDMPFVTIYKLIIERQHRHYLDHLDHLDLLYWNNSGHGPPDGQQNHVLPLNVNNAFFLPKCGTVRL